MQQKDRDPFSNPQLGNGRSIISSLVSTTTKILWCFWNFHIVSMLIGAQIRQELIWASINFLYIEMIRMYHAPYVYLYFVHICTIITFLISFFAALLPLNLSCVLMGWPAFPIHSQPQFQGHHEAAVWLLRHVPESNIADGRNMWPEVNPAGFCWDNKIFHSTHVTCFYIHFFTHVCNK